MQFLRINSTLIVNSIILLMFLSKAIIACDYSILSPCAAYSQADAVFIGKLQKFVRKEKGTLAFFEIEKVYKGKASKIEAINFPDGSCKRSFRVGEKYFVYKEISDTNNSCNRTGLIYKDSPDINYANSLTDNKPIFTIGGSIKLLNEAEKKSVKILIQEGKNIYEPVVNIYGAFEIKATNKGIYNVRIILPFDAAIEVTSGIVYYDVETIHQEGKTTIQYSVEFKANSCDEREINYYKDYKAEP